MINKTRQDNAQLFILGEGTFTGWHCSKAIRSIWCHHGSELETRMEFGEFPKFQEFPKAICLDCLQHVCLGNGPSSSLELLCGSLVSKDWWYIRHHFPLLESDASAGGALVCSVQVAAEMKSQNRIIKDNEWNLILSYLGILLSWNWT